MEGRMNKFLIIRMGITVFVISLFLVVLPQSIKGQHISREITYIAEFFRPRIYFETDKGNTDQKDAYRSKFIKSIYNPSNMPFFCRIEHNIEKSGNIPFRFRIGDLNYVNMLENKR